MDKFIDEWPRVWIDKDRVSVHSYLFVQNPGEGKRSVSIAQLAAVMSNSETWTELVMLIAQL